MPVVLYPFIEEAFSEATEGALTEIKRLSAARAADPMIIVNGHGRITDLLKREKLPFFELGIKRLVSPQTFYLKALFRLFSSSMPLFVFLRTHAIKAVHFHDMLSALSWASAVKMYRIPYIVSVQKPERYSRYACLTLKDAARLTCPSQTVKDFLPSLLRERFKIMPTAADAPFINEKQAAKLKKEFLKKEKLPDDTVILAAETGESKENLEIFAERLAERTSKRIIIFANGSGEDTERIRFTELGDVFPLCRAFLGMRPMCMNSPASYRAMLSGLPVFAAAEGVYPEFILENETGFLMRTFNPDEQAGFVAEKLSDENLIVEAGRKAKESMTVMFKNTEQSWEKLYAELTAPRKGFSLKK